MNLKTKNSDFFVTFWNFNEKNVLTTMIMAAKNKFCLKTENMFV